jgi:hypothetical protein
MRLLKKHSVLYSAKGHFVAANFWTNFHLWIGIPMVLLAAIAGASALSQLFHNLTLNISLLV